MRWRLEKNQKKAGLAAQPTHGCFAALPSEAAAAAEDIPPVLAHVAARLDVLLAWKRVRHPQLPAVPHPGSNDRGEGGWGITATKGFPRCPHRALTLPSISSTMGQSPSFLSMLSLHTCICLSHALSPKSVFSQSSSVEL